MARRQRHPDVFFPAGTAAGMLLLWLRHVPPALPRSHLCKAPGAAVCRAPALSQAWEQIPPPTRVQAAGTPYMWGLGGPPVGRGPHVLHTQLLAWESAHRWSCGGGGRLGNHMHVRVAVFGFARPPARAREQGPRGWGSRGKSVGPSICGCGNERRATGCRLPARSARHR